MDYQPLVDLTHDTLLSDKENLSYLTGTRGLTLDIIKKFRLGLILPKHYEQFKIFVDKKIERYTIPIYVDGRLKEIKAFSRDVPDYKDKWANLLRSGQAYVYPHEILTNNEILVMCEGEMDALLFNSLGIPAVTLTAGASMSFKKDSSKDLKKFFIDKGIFVCYDVDEPGSTGAEKISEILLPIVDDLKIVLLNFTRKERLMGYKDATDYFVKKGANTLEFSKLTNKAKRPGNRKKKLNDYDKAVLMAKDHSISTRRLLAEEYVETFGVPYDTVAADLDLPVSKLRQVGEIIQTYDNFVHDPTGRIPTGFPLLDKEVFRGGPAKGCTVGIVAPSNNGKTIMCENMLVNAVSHKNPIPTVFFSMEQETPQAFERLAAMTCNMSPREVERAFQHEGAKCELISSFTTKIKDNLLICSEGSLSLDDIDILITEGGEILNSPIQLVVVDYMGLIRTQSQNDIQKAGEAAQGLKVLAKRHHCVIVTPLQVNAELVRVRRSKDNQNLFSFRLLEWGDILYNTVVYPHLDYAIGLNRPETSPGFYTLSEGKQEQFRDVLYLNTLKNRDEDSGQIIEGRLNKNNLRIMEKGMREHVRIDV